MHEGELSAKTEGELKPKKIEATVWGHNYFFTDVPIEWPRFHRPDFGLSIEGEQLLLPALGFRGLLKDVHDPSKFNGRQIGQGSEGKVYVYIINGKEYAVKIFDPEEQEKVNQFARLFRSSFAKPNFLEFFQRTPEFTQSLRQIPLKYLNLSPLKEYVASEEYVIMELGPSITLADLEAALIYKPLSSIDDLMSLLAQMSGKSIEEVRKENSENWSKKYLQEQLDRYNSIKIPEHVNQFIAEKGVTKESLQLAIKELGDLKNIIYLLAQNKISPFNSRSVSCDVNSDNFLVRDFDQETRRFSVNSIDLAQQPTSQDAYWDFYIGVESTRGPRERKIYDRIYDECMSQQPYRDFLTSNRVKRGVEIGDNDFHYTFNIFSKSD